jgi:hypothetical protein
VVERILGKAEVGSSILPGGTMFPQPLQGVGETPPPPCDIESLPGERWGRDKLPLAERMSGAIERAFP